MTAVIKADPAVEKRVFIVIKHPAAPRGISAVNTLRRLKRDWQHCFSVACSL